MILFRTDGNSNIGLGHVMRCLSIASAFKEAGEDCLFVNTGDELVDMISGFGYYCLSLDNQYSHMDDEIERIKQIISSKNVNILFVDSYYVTEKYLRDIWQFCVCSHTILVYIDDILAFPYPCDILLNYNIYANIQEYKKLYENSVAPFFLLGMQYTPLRAEFKGFEEREVKKEAKDIFVSTGGADSEHIGLEIVKSVIAHPKWSSYRIHIVVGMMNSDREVIESLLAQQDNIYIYTNIKRMSELMRFCDVAISAAGSTLYELCSTQTPTITYVLADNQIRGAEEFERSGLFHFAGDVRKIGPSALADKLIGEAISLCDDFHRRKHMVQKMKIIIDGKGAANVVNAIRSLMASESKRPSSL